MTEPRKVCGCGWRLPSSVILTSWILGVRRDRACATIAVQCPGCGLEHEVCRATHADARALTVDAKQLPN